LYLENLYQIYKKHPVVCTDSRGVTAGCLFFALKGARFDGNEFARQALENGAAYAVTDNPALPAHPQLIRVPEVLKALQELATVHRRVLGIPVIAITGTNGKTTTKELIARTLAARYTVSVTQGNFNNHIGVPLTLLQLTSDTQIAVVEMGANHPNEIAALCRIAAPDYGLITNIGRAHLEGFGSLAGVQKTKGELYDYLSAHNGTVFYNTANTLLSEMIAARNFNKIICYGVTENNVQLLKSNTALPFLRLAVQDYPPIETHLIGSYNTDNVLAALAVGEYFEMSKAAAVAAINAYVPDNNRSQLIRSERHTVIMDAYNANPSSMTASIENFAQTDAPNKWLILGDMLELGDEAAKEHAAIIDLVAGKQLANVLLVGAHFRQAAGKKYPCFDTVDALIPFLNAHPLTGATILIKGSHGIGLDRLGSGLVNNEQWRQAY